VCVLCCVNHKVCGQQSVGLLCCQQSCSHCARRVLQPACMLVGARCAMSPPHIRLQSAATAVFHMPSSSQSTAGQLLFCLRTPTETTRSGGQASGLWQAMLLITTNMQDYKAIHTLTSYQCWCLEVCMHATLHKGQHKPCGLPQQRWSCKHMACARVQAGHLTSASLYRRKQKGKGQQ
jgi:hypothetical protein